MTTKAELENQLREAACNGDEDSIQQLIQHGVDINAQHPINGWTALHWSAKRGHSKMSSYLLNLGADSHVKSTNGETPLTLASTGEVRMVLGGDPDDVTEEKDLPIRANYLSNPPFPYASKSSNNFNSSTECHSDTTARRTMPHNSLHGDQRRTTDEDELVLKVRVANAVERDFIEIEMPKKSLTYDCLISMMCNDLEVNRMLVYKIRKLPNTIVRKDKDVQRLVDFQELELVLTNRAASESSRNYDGPSVAPRHIDVVY